MKLVVMGISGATSRRIPACSSKQLNHESDEKRRQSSCWVGFG
jgi:hypothetical protein